MPKGKMLVMNEPRSAEDEAEYNEWYVRDHLPQILASCPAITSAKRYRTAVGQSMPVPGTPRYLAVYEIDSDDVMDALRQLGEATQDGRIVMTDKIRSQPQSTFVIYEEI